MESTINMRMQSVMQQLKLQQENLNHQQHKNQAIKTRKQQQATAAIKGISFLTIGAQENKSLANAGA
jgi:hypothetical protein